MADGPENSRVFVIGVCAGIVFLVVTGLSVFIAPLTEGPIILGHFQAAVGLPVIALLSLLILVLLPQACGRIEFKVAGFSLREPLDLLFSG
jgi:hypothetical protein